MKIELLTFAGCPHAKPARTLIDTALAELRVTAEIHTIEVRDHTDALAKHFLGSPSIRVDGQDIEESQIGCREFSMRCRVYQSNSGLTGLPPKELLHAALERAVK